MDPDLIPLETTEAEQAQRRLMQVRRRMIVCVVLVGVLGFGGFAGVLVVGKQRDLNREHYKFRRAVTPGLSEEAVRAQWGEPYRVLWTRLELDAVLSGKGKYKRFDFRDAARVRWAHEPATSEAALVVSKVLQYRSSLDYAEFVLVGPDGRVAAVFTGRQ